MSYDSMGVFSMPLSGPAGADRRAAVGMAAARALESVPANYLDAPCGLMLTDVSRAPERFVHNRMLSWSARSSGQWCAWGGPDTSLQELVSQDDESWAPWGHLLVQTLEAGLTFESTAALVVIQDQELEEANLGINVVRLSLGRDETGQAGEPSTLQLVGSRCPLGWSTHEPPSARDVQHLVQLTHPT